MFLEHLEARELLSRTWFVAVSGSNSNIGTHTRPFRTIQRAANVARPGDFIEIETGTYHEDVRPWRSGTADKAITFEAYNGEDVTVTGTDKIKLWGNAGGDVYHAAVRWDLGVGHNQVFVDGQEIGQPRWPMAGADPSNPTFATADSITLSGDTAILRDTHLTEPANFWNHAVIHIAPGQAWTAQTGMVTASEPGQLTFTINAVNPNLLPEAGDQYYLVAAKNSLDAPGEFTLNRHRLLLWTPAGDAPNAHDVEVKRRDYAFNLSGRSNITVQGLSIFAATINTDKRSANTVLNHLSALHISQFLELPGVWSQPDNAGIQLNGPSSLLENSEIAFSAGDGVYVSDTGIGSRVTNNLIHDVDTSGSDGAGIKILAPNVEADHNTIYNAGRDGIKHTSQNLQILYNTIHDVGLQTTDAGGIYTDNTDGGGTVIAYNTVYNMHSGGFGHTALYLDNNSTNYVVDNNNVYNVDYSLKLNVTSENNTIYNNTLDATISSVFGDFKGDWNGTQLTNNIFLARTQFGKGVIVTGNATMAGVSGAGAADFVSGVSGRVGAPQ